MVEKTGFDVALDVESVLQWMEYQEDYCGVGERSKAAHWDALKATLASALGVKEPKVVLFRYRNKDGKVKDDDGVGVEDLPSMPKLEDEDEGVEDDDGEDDEDFPELPEPPKPKKRRK